MSLSNPARERHFSREGGCRMNRAEWWAQQGKRESSRAQIHQSGCPPSEPLSSLSALATSRHPSGTIQLRDELWRPSVAAVRPPLPGSKQVKRWNVLVELVKYTTIRYFNNNTIGEQNAATTHFVKTEGATANFFCYIFVSRHPIFPLWSLSITYVQVSIHSTCYRIFKFFNSNYIFYIKLLLD